MNDTSETILMCNSLLSVGIEFPLLGVTSAVSNQRTENIMRIPIWNDIFSPEWTGMMKATLARSSRVTNGVTIKSTK